MWKSAHPQQRNQRRQQKQQKKEEAKQEEEEDQDEEEESKSNIDDNDTSNNQNNTTVSSTISRTPSNQPQPTAPVRKSQRNHHHQHHHHHHHRSSHHHHQHHYRNLPSVVDVLNKLHLSHHADNFSIHSIHSCLDLRMLSEVQMKELGMWKVGERNRLIRWIQSNLPPTSAQAAAMARSAAAATAFQQLHPATAPRPTPTSTPALYEHITSWETATSITTALSLNHAGDRNATANTNTNNKNNNKNNTAATSSPQVPPATASVATSVPLHHVDVPKIRRTSTPAARYSAAATTTTTSSVVTTTSFASSHYFYKLTVEGAGCPEVNGIYDEDGEWDGVRKYTKKSLWRGRVVYISLFRCQLLDQTRRWFLSVVPKGQNPGTSLDIDFYTSQRVPDGDLADLPPQQSWLVLSSSKDQPQQQEHQQQQASSSSGQGIHPPPTIEYHLDAALFGDPTSIASHGASVTSPLHGDQNTDDAICSTFQSTSLLYSPSRPAGKGAIGGKKITRKQNQKPQQQNREKEKEKQTTTHHDEAKLGSRLFQRKVVIQGAGTAIVNGTYIPDGEFNGVPMYRKTIIWSGASSSITSNFNSSSKLLSAAENSNMNQDEEERITTTTLTLFQCIVRGNQLRWYLSILPDDCIPGTSLDIDYYSAPANPTTPQLPPQHGWVLAEEGYEPLPQIAIILSQDQQDKHQEGQVSGRRQGSIKSKSSIAKGPPENLSESGQSGTRSSDAKKERHPSGGEALGAFPQPPEQKHSKTTSMFRQNSSSATSASDVTARTSTTTASIAVQQQRHQRHLLQQRQLFQPHQFKVLVKQASLSFINGIYSPVGRHDNVAIYQKQGYWKGHSGTRSSVGGDCLVSLFRCVVRGNKRRWYFSIVPDDSPPGTVRDVDFYTAPAFHQDNEDDDDISQSNFPPQHGWIPINEGHGQPPVVTLMEAERGKTDPSTQMTTPTEERSDDDGDDDEDDDHENDHEHHDDDVDGNDTASSSSSSSSSAPSSGNDYASSPNQTSGSTTPTTTTTGAAAKKQDSPNQNESSNSSGGSRDKSSQEKSHGGKKEDRQKIPIRATSAKATTIATTMTTTTTITRVNQNQITRDTSSRPKNKGLDKVAKPVSKAIMIEEEVTRPNRTQEFSSREKAVPQIPPPPSSTPPHTNYKMPPVVPPIGKIDKSGHLINTTLSTDDDLYSTTATDGDFLDSKHDEFLVSRTTSTMTLKSFDLRTTADEGEQEEEKHLSPIIHPPEKEEHNKPDESPTRNNNNSTSNNTLATRKTRVRWNPFVEMTDEGISVKIGHFYVSC